MGVIVGLEQLTLQALRRYLEGAGWQHLDDARGSSVWRVHRADTDLQVALPMDAGVTDYGEVILSALKVVAYVESRSIDEIAADVKYGGADIVSVRLTPDSPSGEAPLPVAEVAVRALKDLVIGTAAGLEFDRAILPQWRPRATRYLQQVRLSTSPGSFIVSLSLPLYEDVKPATPSTSDQTAMDDTVVMEAEPFGRRVSARMRAVAQSAVSLAVKAAEDSDLTLFESDPMSTGNPKELTALAELGGSRGASYELRFSPSPLVASEAAEPQNIRVEGEQRQLLLKAADLLRALKPKSDITVLGNVVSLTRESLLGPGLVIIKGIERDGPVHRYRALVSEDQYREAERAHMQWLPVSARGNLAVHGNFLVLESLNWFTVQEPLGD